MWFRNLQIYRLAADYKLDLADLAGRLAKQPLTPCGGLERMRLGWLSVCGEDDYVYQQSGQLLIALGIEDKLLPASVIKQAADAKVAEIEAQEGYRPGAKQRKEIRQQVEDEMLPRAFSKRTTVHAWIDPVHGWLAVDTASATKSEALLKLLGDCAPNLPLKLLHTQLSPAAAMTRWLAESDAPTGFSIDRDCELQLPGEDRATVRYVRHALDGEEIGQHIAAGKQATRLGLTWSDRVSFVLTEKLEIKRLQFLDIITEQSAQAEDAEAMFQTEFALMTGELGRLLADLLAALGGEAEA
ncbi:MAG: recombination-associated protein RdgC [Hydrogenophilales bacterium CG03_land_8_20_14_0_80_62_28]|nr:recombination-associated protein RdgC [Betaproteobacteria bacterium]OIO77687.1 MAG: recombination-associated protein RdgC [Hydrogenophilaceae bacterium CG1_02_62_390]PIV24663.1 MAG: recombination-associated protein RdgC [Hydrogenophilales bacterium CG03_land_8_20_14_0_80_62_28]PIW38560.1 MAG: recombination-associated protein RdgC [Hydrogenophilales bacterium CG15_BIG_FIL_POST_REV_8_21_14_020_62_31]PIW71314.1 MAG: recombination-associated protein RdgC [Hydrogenophilales bacterium CG12_big_fil